MALLIPRAVNRLTILSPLYHSGIPRNWRRRRWASVDVRRAEDNGLGKFLADRHLSVVRGLEELAALFGQNRRRIRGIIQALQMHKLLHSGLLGDTGQSPSALNLDIIESNQIDDFRSNASQPYIWTPHRLDDN